MTFLTLYQLPVGTNMNMKTITVFFLTFAILSCHNSARGDREISLLGFESTTSGIIATLEAKNAPGFREHFMLGQAYKKEKQYRKALYHFANSCFSQHRTGDLKLFPSTVYQFADGFHIKSPFFSDAMFEIADIYYLYREYQHVARFVDLMPPARSALYRDAVILKARALTENGKHSEAIESLEKALPRFDAPVSRALLLIRLGSTHKRASHADRALGCFIDACATDAPSWATDIAAGEALSIMDGRIPALSSRQKFTLSRALYISRKFDAALGMIGDTQHEAYGVNSELDRHLLILFVRKGLNSRADEILRHYRNTPASAGMLKAKADELWKMRRKDEALRLYASIADMNAGSESRLSLRRIALDAEKSKRTGFERHLLRYVSEYPDADDAEIMYSRLIHHEIRRKNFASARGLIDRQLTRFPQGPRSDFTRFWLFRLLDADHKRDQAMDVAADMARHSPDSSYSWILFDRLASEIGANELNRLYRQASTPAHKLLYHTLLLAAERDIARRSQRINSESFPDESRYADIERAISGLSLRSRYREIFSSFDKYFSIGNMDAINREITALPDDEDAHRDRHCALARFSGIYGHHHLSILSTIELLKAEKLRHSLALMPEATIRRLFPDAYTRCIGEQSAAFGISPDMLYAVIMAESLFKHDAASSAGALGLMQIMPPTARGIARQLNVREYDLRDACTSIRFGAQYLSWLRRAFNGSIELMVAGYNAGPGNAQQWRSRFDFDDRDLFTEQIPFDETRLYVLRTKKHFIQTQIVRGTPASR